MKLKIDKDENELEPSDAALTVTKTNLRFEDGSTQKMIGQVLLAISCSTYTNKLRVVPCD